MKYANGMAHHTRSHRVSVTEIGLFTDSLKQTNCISNLHMNGLNHIFELG